MSTTTVSSLPLRDIALEGPATGPAVGWDLFGRILALSVTDGRDIAQYAVDFLCFSLEGCKPLLPERVSDVPCLLSTLKTLIAFQKMLPQNCKKVTSTNKKHHKQDQSQNRDSILPNQSIVSKEGLHIDK